MMNWKTKLRLRAELVWARHVLRKRLRAYRYEKRRWRADYDCGWHLYNVLTQDRGHHAELLMELALERCLELEAALGITRAQEKEA